MAIPSGSVRNRLLKVRVQVHGDAVEPLGRDSRPTFEHYQLVENLAPGKIQDLAPDLYQRTKFLEELIRFSDVIPRVFDVTQVQAELGHGESMVDPAVKVTILNHPMNEVPPEYSELIEVQNQIQMRQTIEVVH